MVRAESQKIAKSMVKVQSFIQMWVAKRNYIRTRLCIIIIQRTYRLYRYNKQ
jgi:hypothetical protein